MLSAGFLFSMLVLTVACRHSVAGWQSLSMRYAGATAISLVWWSTSARPAGKKDSWPVDLLLPVLIILFSFFSLSGLTHYVNPVDRDRELASLDTAIFGGHPGVMLQPYIRPWLTTVLQLCYTSYYFIAITFCSILYLQKRRAEFDRAVFGVVFAFFVSYAGYLLVPALGPRFYINDAFTADLMRGPAASAIDSALNLAEGVNRDAFPSGHTMIVLVVLVYAWKFMKGFFWAAVPVAAGLVVSTVYLRYHYAVDVIAGIILAPAGVYIAERLFRFLSGISAEKK